MHQGNVGYDPQPPNAEAASDGSIEIVLGRQKRVSYTLSLTVKEAEQMRSYLAAAIVAASA